MNADDSRAALERELRQVEADIAELRRTAGELHEQVGEIGPTDAAERSALITQAEEQEALAEDLEARRDELRQRLGLE
jgi:predicted  nucleic acid-binding Zn-ribbon protein